MKILLLASISALCLTACVDKSSTKIAEPVVRQETLVSDSDFRKQNWPVDANGVTLPKDATASTRTAQANALEMMPLNIAKEKDFATRGFIANMTKR